MEVIPSEGIRNVVLLGGSGSGKTSLAEALLARAGRIVTAGSIEKGTTVCDFDPVERRLGHSIQAALVHFDWSGARIHLADTPGMPDFAGHAISALAAADTALVVVDARRGVQAATERAMAMAEARGACRMIVINHIDAEKADLAGTLREVRATFGPGCLLLDLPAHQGRDVVELLEHDSGDADLESIAQAHRELVDKIVEEDETLLARYLDDGVEPGAGELHAPFERALRTGHLIPVVFTSARSGAGVPELLHILATLAPRPDEANPPQFFAGDPGTPDVQPRAAVADADRHVIAHVFRIWNDPYLGRVAAFRVFQGTMRRDMQLFVGDARRPMKAAHLYRVFGKDLIEAERLLPGEIGALTKVDEAGFDSVLHDSHDDDHIHLKATAFPAPMQGLAISPRRNSDEQRLSETLARLAAEDPALSIERDGEGREWVLRGLGELHLKTLLERMSQAHRIEVDTRPPRIPYRETIQSGAEGHYRHRKQSGGAGQFGEVFLRIEPLPRGAGYQFVDQVKGGAIPGVFMPAVEKGVRRALDEGVLAGYPVVDVRVVVHDGKTHPVDGKEVAFASAGRHATIDAILQASPTVLEPIVEIEIEVPEQAIGDVTGDLSSRRGHVTGTLARAGGAVVRGLVPLAEIVDYASRLKSMTGGAGQFSFAFSRYEPAPPGIQRQLAAQHRPREAE